MDINEMVELFEEDQLMINYDGATPEQMLQLETVLDGMTTARPHDNMSFSQHMRHFSDKFCYLTCNGDTKVVSSYARGCVDLGRVEVPIAQFLEVAGCDLADPVEFSEFESIL